MSEFPRDLPAAAHRAGLRVLVELKGVQKSTADSGPVVSPVLKWVDDLSRLEGRQFFVASRVASELGISVQAVRKYTKNKVLGDGKLPSYRAQFSKKMDEDEGGIIVGLYTQEDIDGLRQFLSTRQVVYKT